MPPLPGPLLGLINETVGAGTTYETPPASVPDWPSGLATVTFPLPSMANAPPVLPLVMA